MSILPEAIDRYRKFFSFIIKYWNSDLVKYSSDRALGKDTEIERSSFDQDPEEFVKDLKTMGPTYIKLGQLLSTRPDLLPESYLEALCQLQDDVETIPYEQIHETFEEEIGSRISKCFKEFDEIPMASASIGQVHKAVLHSGKKVAVKVQRPQIREQFLKDLNTLQEIATWAVKNSEDARKYNVAELVDELRYTLLQELDYNAEAEHLMLLAENLKHFNHLYVPQPILDYTSSKVLTMELVEGQKVTKVSPLKRMEKNLDPLLDDLICGYLKQVIEDGFAHADPHPGNIFITNDNRLALMDLGMTAHFTKELQSEILQLMIGLSSYDSNQVSKVILAMSHYDQETANIDGFNKNISRLIQESEISKADTMQTGRHIIQMNRIAAHHGIQIPAPLNMLAKILLNMDQIVAELSPRYNVNETIRGYIKKIMHTKTISELKPENIFNLILETKKLTEKMPERLNAILENLSTNQFKVKVDAINEDRFTDAFQKVANRITLGLIIAAMIIGAALLIQIPTSWKIGRAHV